jgi:protein-S-isoprenylcysteine O-methyltransferase Ste14
MKLDSALALAVASLTLFSFGLSMRWFRNRKDRSAAKTRLIVSAYVCAAIQLPIIALSHPVPVWCRWAGVGLYLAGAVIFWWARASHRGQRPAFAGSNVMPTFLTQTGPYRLIRHPIYSGYLFAWFAGAVIAGQPWLLLPAGWMAVLHYLAARQEERYFAQSPMARDYEAYQRRAGMFLPSVGAVAAFARNAGSQPAAKEQGGNTAGEGDKRHVA